ncbi:hypothetical protein PVAND_001605 [Polypedilum vanderplanki]|uniref:Decapping nuclease n=1 Tax=Polypedilum vanderplanki TaxID=319348 RepID=A0A9J6BNW2_POLVA|nr:hypothetical protein PVAND_001605 [Polypedilum vanderplanki]
MDLKPYFKRREHISMTPAVIVGAYSIDRNRNYQDGLKNLKYLKIPKEINFDLNQGLYIDKPELDIRERLHQLTSFIMHNSKDVIKEKKVDADFVCFRGVLRYLLETPYNGKQAWEIDAVKYKGTIYMCLLPSQEQIRYQNNENSETRKFRQYGYKFESYLMADHPQRNPKGSTEPVYEAEEFNVVMSRSINGLKLIFANEIDGVKSDHVITSVEELKQVPLVEVKSRREEHHLNKFKTLAWYCQSAVTDLFDIYVGIRNFEGIVTDIKLINIKEIAKEQTKHFGWEISVCKNFLKNFLNEVKNDTKNVDDAHVVFRYSWDPNIQQQTVNLDLLYSTNFLPKQFIDFMESLNE